MTSGHAERLARVRNHLRAAGANAFFLQRTDSHGSEYLQSADERVAWLSGFTGSAAILVVTDDSAAVFSDGRYTLQLADELDPALFEACHVTENPPFRWLTDKLPDGAVIGYDSALTKQHELKRLQAVAKDKSGAIKALAANPVDVAWANKPSSPKNQIRQLDERYSGEASAEKRLRLGQQLAEAGADTLIMTGADSIAWLLNVRGNDIPFNPLCLSYALLDRNGGCRWFVDHEKIPSDMSFDNAVSIDTYEAFLPALSEMNGQVVAYDPALVHLAFIDAVRNGGGELKSMSDPVFAAKARKNAIEQEGARQAHLRDGAAVCRFLCWLEGIPLDGSIDEIGAAKRLHEERAKDPLFQGPSFETISGHGSNGAIPHYRVTPESSRPLTGGTLYLVDSGGQYLDATTDITRTVAMGDITEDMRKHFTAVLKGHIALAIAVFPADTNGGQLDALARLPLWQMGLDFDHGTGHGIGSFLCVHEGPARIAKKGSAVAFQPGMILSNEPGYYRSGEYGIRIENLMIVREAEPVSGGERPMHSFETITRAPIDRRLIVASMLSAEERQWIDDFHATVLSDVGPLLDEATCDWLQAACSPL